MLTLRFRKTPLCAVFGYFGFFWEGLNNDVIDTLIWLKSKNYWKKSLLLFPNLSISENRNSVSTLVLLLEAFCREENIVNFPVSKKNSVESKG